MSRLSMAVGLMIIGSVAVTATSWKIYTLGRTAGKLSVQAEFDKFRIDQGILVEKEMARLQGIKDDALKESNIRAQRNAVAAKSARNELDRLRNTIAATTNSTASSCPTSSDSVNTLAVVFGECAAELTEMGQNAQGHLNDALTLRKAWPTGR